MDESAQPSFGMEFRPITKNPLSMASTNDQVVYDTESQLVPVAAAVGAPVSLPLEELLRSDPAIESWLMVWGLLTPHKNCKPHIKIFIWIWISIWLTLIALIAIYGYIGDVFDKVGRYTKAEKVLYSITVDVAINFQYLATLFGMILLRYRLSTLTPASYLDCYKSQLTLCVIFWGASIIFTIISTILGTFGESVNVTVVDKPCDTTITGAPTVATSSVAISLVAASVPGTVWRAIGSPYLFPLWGIVSVVPMLTTNLLFVLGDIQHCISLVESLSQSVHLITVEGYSTIKNSVDATSFKHRWSNTVVIGVAVINTLSMVIIPFCGRSCCSNK